MAPDKQGTHGECEERGKKKLGRSVGSLPNHPFIITAVRFPTSSLFFLSCKKIGKRNMSNGGWVKEGQGGEKTHKQTGSRKAGGGGGVFLLNGPSHFHIMSPP